MNVLWTETAVARLEQIEDYIAEDNPKAAERFVGELIDVGNALADLSERGRTVSELPGSGLREIVHKGYRLVCRTRSRQVEILTVFEGHRLLRTHELK